MDVEEWILGFQIEGVSAGFLAETQDLVTSAEEEIGLVSVSESVESDNAICDSQRVEAIFLLPVGREGPCLPFVLEDLGSLHDLIDHLVVVSSSLLEKLVKILPDIVADAERSSDNLTVGIVFDVLLEVGPVWDSVTCDRKC